MEAGYRCGIAGVYPEGSISRQPRLHSKQHQSPRVPVRSRANTGTSILHRTTPQKMTRYGTNRMIQTCVTHSFSYCSMYRLQTKQTVTLKVEIKSPPCVFHPLNTIISRRFPVTIDHKFTRSASHIWLLISDIKHLFKEYVIFWCTSKNNCVLV